MQIGMRASDYSYHARRRTVVAAGEFLQSLADCHAAAIAAIQQSLWVCSYLTVTAPQTVASSMAMSPPLVLAAEVVDTLTASSCSMSGA